MNSLEKIEKLIKEKNGTILTADLEKNDIPRTYLAGLVAEGKLEKVGRGVYVASDSIEDEMYALQSRYPKLIYSHETALFLHALSDRTPFEYSATVPSGYKVVDKISERVKTYYIKKELHSLGMLDMASSFGNPIRVYNIERTICDCVRSRNRIDVQILNDALKRYVRLKSTDFGLLMDYAKIFKADKVIKNYLEVLL